MQFEGSPAWTVGPAAPPPWRNTNPLDPNLYGAMSFLRDQWNAAHQTGNNGPPPKYAKLPGQNNWKDPGLLSRSKVKLPVTGPATPGGPNSNVPTSSGAFAINPYIGLGPKVTKKP
jgi:hypothetical protein